MRWIDALSAANIAAYYRTSNQTTAFPGEALFPARKQAGLSLKILESKGAGARVLKRAGFDTLPPKRDRLGPTLQAYEMPFFREQMALKEVDRQELLKIGDVNNRMFDEVIRSIYDDRIELINGARAQLERMRMMALFTGGVNIVDSEGLDVTIDYGFDTASQRTVLAGADMWTNPATSHPIADIEAAKKAAGLTGTVAALMNEKTFSDMASSESLINSLYFDVRAGASLAPASVISGMERFSIRVIVVDSLIQYYWYIDEAGNRVQYVPDNIVTIVPLGEVGNTWFGTTPEEADLNNGQSDARVEIVETGVAITSLVTPGPPVQIMTTASMIAMPTLPNIERMHIIQTST